MIMLSALPAMARSLLPGILVAAVVALAARFLADQYGAPAMLMALLLGMSFAFLSEDGRCVEGIAFTARTLLRLGVALLGARISLEALATLGPPIIGLIVLGVLATIVFGVLASRLLGRGWRFGLLTGGSVAICGASAAMALASVLPRSERSERDLVFTVLGVTVLSTIAMVLYPLLTGWMELGPQASGVFLGGTIHDVAQVVGAGYTVSDPTGDTATLVKLIRVAMLAPVVVALTLVVKRGSGAVEGTGKRGPLVPFFLIGFVAIAAVNSAGYLPAQAAVWMGEASKWLLLTAMAAVGMKTALRSMLDVGHQAIILILAETVFIAVLFVGILSLL
ncbi:conserved hypothetical integral membrane protein [Salinihabitans flavidus]|uniref:Conserved hypothetical integral membrane protein n=1 Tax=Salinihabitans flavidus TaxID=569882 RepID=A0A1H8UK83_9RHOB|nr:YeiH family protein [Salinihabitans flavidus]SEP03496.1 conserved hypothetical integral membrane protein [Salinihabitans flavidus]